MRTRHLIAALSLSQILIIPSIALAQEQMRPVVVSGNWAALVYSKSMVAAPEVCLAINMAHGIAFRASLEGLEFRVINEKWSLPTEIQGSVAISVGDWKTKLDISSNSSTMVSSRMQINVALELLNAMDKNNLMTVAAGADKPINVSLDGSTRVTNAFKTCAGIKDGSKGGGSNPFQ